jgi:glycosyltransferase involved in cell wall biosynthesis
MTRIGFWFDYGLVYSGGLNYFRNLLHAVHQVDAKDAQTVLFIGKDLPPHLEEELSRTTQVVKLDLLTRGTADWFVHRSLYRSLSCQVRVEGVLRKHRIDVVSHPSMVDKLSDEFKLISWIADFQYLHLPHLFPGLNAAKRQRQIRQIHANSDAVIVSSRDALRDFASVVGSAHPERTHVLPFVSQTRAGGDMKDWHPQALVDKYKLPKRYFLLPNQFWEHKNHRVAFEAVSLLKKAGIDVTVACTGWMKDPRHASSEYIDSLRRIIDDNGLHENIRLLGSIDYADVIGLMRTSIAVLNPSLFEGWSSSVEEAKSLGKPMVISDIAVHREQSHPGARYFAPDSPEAMAAALKDAWQTWPAGWCAESESQAQDALKRRTTEFGQRYIEIVRNVVERSPATPAPV